MLANEVRGSYLNIAPEGHVILFSGGLDSTATAVKLMGQGIKPTLLFMDTGAKDIPISLQVGREIATALGLKFVIDKTLASYGKRTAIGSEVYIPRRNILFAMVAATYGNHIYIGGIKGDFTNDKTPKVFAETRKLLNLSGSKKEAVLFLDSILWDLDKLEVAQLLIDAGYAGLVRLCVGCYSGQEIHCGQCIACVRKYAMLKHLGIDDGFVFTADPTKHAGAAYYRDLIDNDAYFENIPENVMRKVLGYEPVPGGDRVREFSEKEAITNKIIK